MMYAKVEIYEGMGRTHWALTVRDLDGGPDEQGLIKLSGGILPDTGEGWAQHLWNALDEAMKALESDPLTGP